MKLMKSFVVVLFFGFSILGVNGVEGANPNGEKLTGFMADGRQAPLQDVLDQEAEQESQKIFKAQRAQCIAGGISEEQMRKLDEQLLAGIREIFKKRAALVSRDIYATYERLLKED